MNWFKRKLLGIRLRSANKAIVRELERMLGRKTMEVEILREALSKADSKKRISRPILLPKDGSR